jgi:hypothetical protein
MLRVSIVIELLRSRPQLVVWSAIVGQALLWVGVPALIYPTAPGNLPLLLAVGHDWRLGSPLGPPLASWVAELSFELTGRGRFGLYALSQICVALTCWTTFVLARAIVGSQHAALSVLLMTGIVTLSPAAVEFGPQVLVMPLTALAVLHYWRAIGEQRGWWWIAVGFDLGLLGLTSYCGLLLAGLIGLFTALQPRGRTALATLKPYVGGAVYLLLLVPHLVWLCRWGMALMPSRAALAAVLLVHAPLTDWLIAVGSIVVLQAGLLGLFALAVIGAGSRVPVFVRPPVDRFARSFVYFFALMPPLLSIVLSVLSHESISPAAVGPVTILSGLAAVVAAGDIVRLHRAFVLAQAWVGLLVIPPLAIVAAVVLVPWIGVAPEIDRPARAIGEFFTETFRRRTAHALTVVAGDAAVTGLIAMDSADRPRPFFVDRPELNAISEDVVRAEGAIVVWPVSDNAETLPAAIKARFPDLVVEVPQSFPRPFQGRLALYRIGWAMIRPASEPAASKH